MPGLEQALEMQRPPIVRFGVGQIDDARGVGCQMSA